MIGKEEGAIDSLQEELLGVAKLMQETPELFSAVTNPIYPTAARKKVLAGVLERLALSKVMNAFLLLMFDKGRIGLLDAVAEVYGELADEEKGIARAEVLAAEDLDNETVEQIKAGLAKLTGKDVTVEVRKDPALIGGVVTRIGDLVLDGSVRTQLANLKEFLKRSEAV
ncbi:MAG: ATP synthase F1 subunit delta [Deltaproteobacteria bacterium]|nr:ATP synthase F1 subunit delta [Deltaproteobacteria bacterium]